MGKITNNVIWDFFKSVKLALFTFFILAITSIIGTVIPQNSPEQQYIQMYGESTAKLFKMLDISDMYNAWWFIALLILFCVNLTVCSINRIPDTWRLVVADNLKVTKDRIRKMRQRITFASSLSVADAASEVERIMTDGGWKPEKAEKGDEILFASQKGNWTRMGVYIVHVSILVIFAGAIIGSFFGYKASIMLPEMAATDSVFERSTQKPIKLGFTVRCDRFDLTYYDNGAPKEYRSDITILENGKELFSTPVIVNDPMQYKGITFYQSSYNGFNEYRVTLENQTNKSKRSFRVAPGKKIAWPQAGISFGIVNHQPPNQWGQFRVKIWFSDGKGNPTQFWMDGSRPISLERPDGNYLISAKQFFATGLQVAKDPGVWWVYTGCILMLLGLAVAFFLSHKRVWVYIANEGGQTDIIVTGTSNKNKLGFEKDFDALGKRFQQHSDKLKLIKD